MDPVEAIKASIGARKILSITAPMLAHCPHSLVIYELRARGRGVELIMRKTEMWLINHARFPEAEEVRSLNNHIVKLLESSLIRAEPVELVEILTPVLVRWTALVHVRKHYGYAGMKAFTAATQAQNEDPEDMASALSAAQSAQARARIWRARQDDRAAPNGAAADGGGDRAGGRGRGGRGGRFGWRKGRGGAGSGGANATTTQPAATTGNGAGATGAPEEA